MDPTLQQAISAIKTGDKSTGKRLLSQYLNTNREDANAWLWMSAAVDTDEQQRFCLEQVLHIQPDHPQAKAGLARLLAPPPPAVPIPPPAEPELPSAFTAAWEPEDAQPSALSDFTWEMIEAEREPTEAPSTTPDWAVALEKPAPSQPPPLATTPQSDPLPAAAAAQGKRPPVRRAYPWHQVWITVLLSPGVDSFRAILADPKLSIDRGLIWIFLAALFQLLLTVGSVMAFGLPSALEQAGLPTPAMQVLLIMLVLMPVLAALYALMYALGMGITHLSASVLGGEGKYEHLVYATAAYSAPLYMIGGLLALVPYLNLAGFLIGIYAFVLQIMAIQAVYRLGQGRAVAVIFLPGVVAGALCCLLGFVLSGPIEQLMQEIVLRGSGF